MSKKAAFECVERYKNKKLNLKTKNLIKIVQDEGKYVVFLLL